MRNIFGAIIFAAAPIAISALSVAASAQAAASGLAQAQAHLRAVTSMTANFTQTDRRG